MLLRYLQVHILCPIVTYEASIPQAVNEIFDSEVVRVEQSLAEASNADNSSRWQRLLSLCLAQWFMANSLFKLGTLYFKTSFKFMFEFLRVVKCLKYPGSKS